MRKFFLTIFIILLLGLCSLFLFDFFQSKKNLHVDESLTLLKPTINRLISKPTTGNGVKNVVVKKSVKKGAYHPTRAYRGSYSGYGYSKKPKSYSAAPGAKYEVKKGADHPTRAYRGSYHSYSYSTKPKSYHSVVPRFKDGVKNGADHPTHAYRSYRYSTKPKSDHPAALMIKSGSGKKNGVKNGVDHSTHAYRSYSYSTDSSDSYSYSTGPTSAGVSDSGPMAPAPTAAPVVQPAAPATTKPDAGSESAFKYVLFSVTYDSQMIAGETKSLQLRMSPRSALAKLEQALTENKIQQSQIKEIEKVKNTYRYVSAHLVAHNNCLRIEKKMPEEDKVYLPNVNESSADQIWHWDLTAPELPKAKMCHLSLFIRFCINQNDCLPMQDPDKEFNINVEITVGQKIYKWFTDIGALAGIAISILTVITMIGGWRMWRRKKSSTS